MAVTTVAPMPLPTAGKGLEASLQAVRPTLLLDVSLSVQRGETVALLGPNGAGKSTLLRVLAGLERIVTGRVVLDGAVLDDVSTRTHVLAERRSIGLVFQDHLLFPHLSALENVAFGLRCRGVPRAEARRRAQEWLERIALGRRAAAAPAELSGGEAQRVALARALIVEPRLLLLDEPLASLDASTRLTLRRHLQDQLQSFDGVRLLVTHDPLEAVALGDRLVILEEGGIVQTGSLSEITAQPRSPYVADLVGVNLFHGQASAEGVTLDDGALLRTSGAGRGPVLAVVHPRAVALHRHRPEGTPRNVWSGRVASMDWQGDRVRVRVDGPVAVVAEVTSAAVTELELVGGTEVWVSIKAAEVAVYPA